MVLRIPTPPKEPKQVTPRGKVVAGGATIPANTKPKRKFYIFCELRLKCLQSDIRAVYILNFGPKLDSISVFKLYIFPKYFCKFLFPI